MKKATIKQVSSFRIPVLAIVGGILILVNCSNIEAPYLPPPNSENSSSAGVSGNCPESVKNFACSWQPSTVISGENSKITFAYDAPNGTTCKGEVWKPLLDGFVTDTVSFPLDKDIKTAGRYGQNNDGVVLKNSGINMTEMSISWPIVAEPQEYPFATIGKLSCTGNITCQMNGIACTPLAIKGVPAPTYSGALTFNNYSYSSAYYSGKTPTITSSIIRISNNSVAKCTKIRLEITGGTYSQSKEADIAVDGTINLTTYTATTALPSVNAPQTLTAKVIATCQGGNYTLETATATLVPDLKLSGTCAWSTGKDDDGNYVTTTGNGALPSGNILSNIYGRCGSITGSGTDDSYVLQAKDYSGNGLAYWPANGKAGLIDMLYNNIKTNITCTPVITAVCPSLKVVTANVCEGKTNIASYCPGVAWSDIKWGTKIQNSGTPAGCYFVNFSGSLSTNNLYITTINGSKWMVNGTEVASGNNVLLSNLNSNRKDGGFYVYLQGTTQSASNADNYALEKPFCDDGIHRLSCTGMPTQSAENSAITQPTPTCRDLYATASNINWVNEPIWANPTAGNYNVTVSATCGSSGTLQANCGTLKVLPVITKDVCGTTFIEFNATETSYYNVKILPSCSGSELLCYGNDGISKSVTYGGNTPTREPGGAPLVNGHVNWVSGWSAVKHATDTTPLVVSAGKVYCKTDW